MLFQLWLLSIWNEQQKNRQYYTAFAVYTWYTRSFIWACECCSIILVISVPVWLSHYALYIQDTSTKQNTWRYQWSDHWLFFTFGHLAPLPKPLRNGQIKTLLKQTLYYSGWGKHRTDVLVDVTDKRFVLARNYIGVWLETKDLIKITKFLCYGLQFRRH